MLDKIRNLRRHLKTDLEIQKKAAWRALKSQARYQDPKGLIPYGHKVYSQNEEDGMLQEIFRRIGQTRCTFVEIGVGDGLENNTLALLHQDWRGLWLESSTASVRKIERGYASILAQGQLAIVPAQVTRENINDLVTAHWPDSAVDLLSLDIDGNDFHVLNALTALQPRVIVMEYNARFAPPIAYCMAYRADHVWDGSDCFGVSLSFLEKALAGKGYCLVGCDLTGTNAFFVQRELVGDLFLAPFTASQHYEPARYELGVPTAGHPPSYRTLAERQGNLIQ